VSQQPAGSEHDQVLVRAVAVLERANIPYALMGGLAAASVGRERSTKDVDLFVTPGHAGPALDALGEAGFHTERTDPGWLYKAFWEDTLVDLIFESSGGIHLDEAMRAHLRDVTVLGREIKALAAEDIVVIKAIANEEHRPRHWHDGLAIVANAELDWPYLLWRSRGHAARVLSLLLYAVSEGVRLPAEPLRELFGEAAREGSGQGSRHSRLAAPGPHHAQDESRQD
jgi:predicted nucleotidyltransferase